MNNENRIFTIPNILTLIRILTIPLFVYFAMGIPDDRMMSLWTLIAFAGCAATDILDGFIARRFNLATKLGKILDPAADKLMNITALVCLSILDRRFMLFAILIFAKEVTWLIMGLLLMKKAKADLNPNWLGKFASFLLVIGAMCSFFYWYWDDIFIPVHLIVTGIAVATSYVSAIYYLKIYVFDKKKSKTQD